MPGQFPGRHPEFARAAFLRSASALEHLPVGGAETAFAGRSNAGKSSALNAITRPGIARVSKTPGRTQLLNLFTLGSDDLRLVDLPGYGYARVPANARAAWAEVIVRYLERRAELRGLVLMVDIRRGLSAADTELMALWGPRPLHIVLTKSDKVGRGPARDALKALAAAQPRISAQLFSALNGDGVETLRNRLADWLT
ncbi:MAG: ribosome biogenesis GTP-binding protein YihA/YsxC [Acidiferrobacteraceae bacterium]